MAILNNFLFLLLSSISLLQLVISNNPSGFISLDCGIPANFTYTEPITGIDYESDALFVDSGTVHNISFDSVRTDLNQQLRSLRSFPEGKRNCYKLKVKSGTKYLIRASFMYGNYDGRRILPEFELHFGANLWDLVKFEGDFEVHKEIIQIVSKSNLEICLVNNGSGIPIISALELRPLRNKSYVTPSMSLATFLRLDYGSINNRSYRYKDDEYDRIWNPSLPIPDWTSIHTSEPININDGLFLRPAPAVMNTAASPLNLTAPMEFHLPQADDSSDLFVFLYFSELQKLQSNESRSFDIFLNGERWYKPTVSLVYLDIFYVFSTTSITSRSYNFSLLKTADSTHPPILNAIEVFRGINFHISETNEQDVDAVVNIKAMYGVARNWQGDPCAPSELIWEGISCSSVDSQPPRIASLNLSSCGLTGKIAQDIANLKMLEILDLSSNSLWGQVPEFLTQLPSLRVLNLERNNFSGLIPAQLIEKSKNGSLSLRFGGNPNLLTTTPSENKKRNVIVPVVASVGGLVALLLLIAAGILWKAKGREQQGTVSGEARDNVEQIKKWEMNKRPYSYSEILRITNNFEKMLGEGGFGKVYYGRIDNTEVAVKMLSSQSVQGYQQFEAEVELLLRVHHRNLTNLVGYCNESTNKGLIYEYMSRGNLRTLISGSNSDLLNWETRLHIAVDAAHGLEYLHSGIRPAIIHRDVKSSNILLDDKFQAKVSDFGLSRIFHTEGDASHVTTNVVGTPGYVDPRYFKFNKLNEKSDVYGFGVVLLEIITGKPVLTKTDDMMTHIYQLVASMVSQGDIDSIIDPKIREDFDVNSIWKAVEIAMSCASHTSANRPNMSQIVVELNLCLATLSRNKDPQLDSVATVSISLPEAR